MKKIFIAAHKMTKEMVGEYGVDYIENGKFFEIAEIDVENILAERSI